MDLETTQIAVAPPRETAHAAIAPPNIPLSKASMVDAVTILLHTFEKTTGLPKQIADHNRRAMSDLVECIYSRKCKKRPKLVILESIHFQWALMTGERGAEAWVRSTVRAFDKLGVSYVYSPQDPEWAQSVHALFARQVAAVIFDRDAVKACFAGPTTCARSARNPDGIPAWKIFSWYDGQPGDEPDSPLGHAWTLMPEMFHEHGTYVGYSIQAEAVPFVDPADRVDHAWILANLETYFYLHHNIWSHDYFERAGLETGMEFIAALHPEQGRLSAYPYTHNVISVPSNLVDIGTAENSGVLLPKLAESRMLIGLFDPRDLPIVYESLNAGVPFLNPIRNWDVNNPSNRSEWQAGSFGVKHLDPPYVYNVFKDDYAGFKAAIEAAIKHPIKSFVLEHMKEAAVEERIGKILDRDWKTEAQTLLHPNIEALGFF
ncbi:hypothetical protein C8J57DRAFT_1248342 [Mycena rebaudengoi]|nr:hypothetical protein C8J57DRAFT_1248342 [Mycena rebaudengoi]